MDETLKAKSEENKIKETNFEENRNVVIDSDTPEMLTNNIYTPAFLREHIGKLMRVEFLIGTNNLVDRIGILIDVGASYILLRSLESNTTTYCDIYSIKFVTISNNRIYPINYSPNSNYEYNNILNNQIPNMENGINNNVYRYY